MSLHNPQGPSTSCLVESGTPNPRLVFGPVTPALENISEGSVAFAGQMPPFLKWAGGKRWLTPKINNLIPKNIERYIEPFLGSGAIYFHLKPNIALLSDANRELIETYISIRDEPSMVEAALGVHARAHNQDYYYKIRDEIPLLKYERAARFIYLNRTCWNGLYRVNKLGKFNVPIGTKNTVVLLSDNFKGYSRLFTGVTFSCCDFISSINKAKSGDFIFADPPYTVKHNNNGFIKYNQKLFSWDDQMRLRDALYCAVDRGAMALVTNASHASVVDLYSDRGKVVRLGRQSVLAASAAFRQAVEEVAIAIGYEPAADVCS